MILDHSVPGRLRCMTVSHDRLHFPGCADNKQDDDEPGRIQESCGSYAATVLFAARVCRVECSTVVHRPCTQGSRWTSRDDGNLVRRLGSLKNESTGLPIDCFLGLRDVSDLESRV